MDGNKKDEKIFKEISVSERDPRGLVPGVPSPNPP